MNIKIEQINCNILGAGGILTEYLKQALQEKNYAIVQDNSADIIISGAVTVTPAGQAIVGKGLFLAGLVTALTYWLARRKK